MEEILKEILVAVNPPPPPPLKKCQTIECEEVDGFRKATTTKKVIVATLKLTTRNKLGREILFGHP